MKTLANNASGAALAASGALEPEFKTPEAKKFETPATPPGYSDAVPWPTAHAYLADVMREVVKVDDAALSELFNKGVILEPEARAATEAQRAALKVYDAARDAAAALPVAALLRQAHDAFDADPALAKKLLVTAAIALDFQSHPEAPDQAVIVWNEDRSEGVVFRGQPESEMDSYQCFVGGAQTSSLGLAFDDLYGEQDLIREKILFRDADPKAEPS